MTTLPEKIGKYEVLDIAGHGNMGIVYVGHDPYQDHRVAIKVCSVEGDESMSTAARVARKLFFNEAHTAGALDHPNILKVFDAGEQDGQPYIVMEYIDGGETLAPHVDPEALLPVESAVKIIYQTAKALDYAHRRGVIHRDIKSTNIMLTPDGQAKIADFGIAQYALSDATQVMGVLGSPRYMSPEQAREEELNQQTDLFSLGVVAYELLTGRPPFVAKGISRLIMKILNAAPAPPRESRPEIPGALQEIVLKALEKPLDRRYASGREMAAELASLFQTLATQEPQIQDADKLAALRGLRFFNDFSDAELAEVVHTGVWETYAPHDRIITEGRLEHSFYILAAGDVSVRKGESEISALGPGDCFGEMGYLAKTHRTASIVARDEVVLIKIDSTLMEQASMGCQLRFNQVFLRTLIERLERTSERLAEHVGKPA